MAFLVIGALGENLFAQDITGSYLTNAGFENGTSDGWDIGHTNTSWYNDGVDYYHEHFGNPGTDEGSHWFGFSSRWNGSNGSNTVSLSQTTGSTLPKGHYYASCDFKAADYSNKTGNRSPVRMYVNAGSTELGVSSPYHLAANFTGTSVNYMPTADWTPLGCYFNNTSNQEVTIMAKSSLWSENSTQLAFDNFKLYDLSKASPSSPVDMTGVIANNKMEAAALVWSSGFGQQTNTSYANFSGQYMLESWVSNANNLGNKDVNQTVNNLPNGKYRFSAYVNATKQGAADPSAVTGVSLYAGSDAVSCGTGNGAPELFSVETIVKDGSLKLGIKTESCTANWVAWDNLSLQFLDPTVELIAQALPENGEMEADVWYYVDFTSNASTSMLNGPAMLADDGYSLLSEVTTESFTDKTFEAGRYYIKSATANVLTYNVEPMEGWEVITALPEDLNDYFYTFYSGLLGLKLNTGTNQGTDYKTLWYTSGLNPEVDKDGLMTLVSDGDYQVVTCANYPNYMLQTEWNAPWNYRTHDNGGGDLAWGHMTFLNDGKWTINNGYYPDNQYWGPWNNTAEDGAEIAANKPAETASKYDIHAIKRGKYLQHVLTADYYNREDITYVVTNPEAERRSAVGWTLSQDGAFGTINNSELAGKTNDYYFQYWQASGNISNRQMHQTLTELKAGYYTLEVNTSTTATGAYLYVNGEQVDLSENVDGVASVKVFVEADGTLDYGVKLDGYTSNWVAFDNFKLYYSTTDPLIEDGIYYLYSQYDDQGAGDEHRFLARGYEWGTCAVVDNYGMPIQITNISDNIVTMKFVDTNGYMKSTWWLYTDGGANDANTFKVVESTVDGLEGYHFATQQVSTDVAAKQFMYVWLQDAAAGDYYRVAGNGADGVEGDYSRTVWKLLSKEERNAIVENYPTANMERVIDAAQASGKYQDIDESIIASQFGYWLNATYEAVDKTELIGTATFADGKIGDWIYTKSPNGRKDPGYGSGLTELYEGEGTWSQTIQGLTPGIYRLSVNAFERHGNSDNDRNTGAIYGNLSSAYMTANGEQVHIAAWHEASDGTDPNSMAQAAAKFAASNYENEVFVYVGDDGKLDISVSEPGYLGGVWFIMNNFTLTYYDPIVKEIATPEGEYYLRNKATGEYITFDGFWGTYYSMSDAGKTLTLETSEDGFTLMHTTYLSNSDDVSSNNDTENYFYSYKGRPLHAYSNGNSTEGGEKWVFYEVGENTGIYNIMNYMTGNYLSGDEGYDENTTKGWGGLLKETAASDDQSVQWELVSYDDLLAALTAEDATYPQNASFMIGEPDLIAGFNNVYEEFYRWKVMGNSQTKYSDWNTSNITTFNFDSKDGKSEGNSTYAYCSASDYPDILQTIENVPAGLYVVECQAVFRDGLAGTASDDPSTTTGSSSRKNADRLADGTYVNRAYLYANEQLGEEPTDDAMAIRDRAWIYENAQLMPVNIATSTTFDNAANTDIFTEFRDQQHTVQLPIYVTDSNGDGTGTLTIGVLQEIGINDNLLVFDRFRLTYYGTAYSGDEVKTIAKGNLERLAIDYTNYQKNTITDKEIAKVNAAISSIDSESDFNTNSETVAKYNKVTQDYGETSISWYIYNVLKTDYDNGAYTTASDQTREDGLYPYVDEANKQNIVKHFGADPDNTNTKSVYDNVTYTAGTLSEKTAMWSNGELSDLREAIGALRTYVTANAETRYVEDEKVIKGDIEDTDEARDESRMARMALLTGSRDAITTEDGKYPTYETNALMFVNSGAKVTAPELNKIVKNARCWAPRDAYGHRFYDYTNYYGAGPYSYTINIEGLMTGKYLVTISESHNNELKNVKFTAKVGDKEVVSDKQMFREDGSVWQTYTHSWQDVSCVANITDQFEPVTLTFTGGGEGAAGNATMNICNLRIYRMDDVEMLLLDENDTQLAKNGIKDGDSRLNYSSVKVLLKREMQTNQWNTITLPVSLTKEQVISGFGEGTVIGVMDGYATDYPDLEAGDYPDQCIHFKSNDMSAMADTDIAIEEGKVYIIKPTADPAVAKGETAKYKNSNEGQPTYIDVEGPIYYLDYVKYTLKDYGDEGKECYIVEKDDETGEVLSTTVRTHDDPETGTPIEATGARNGKLSLQMDGTYVTKVVPVGENDYVYAFQTQGEEVKVVELDPQYSKTYEGFGDTVGRKFKGFRGWVTANYDDSNDVKNVFTVLINEGDGETTIIRGIDSTDGYSEITVGSKGIYDLQGRAIDSDLFHSGACPKGVYIVNGKKVFVK